MVKGLRILIQHQGRLIEKVTIRQKLDADEEASQKNI